MRSIDLNADLGEYQTVAQRDCERQVLGYVSSCNIACGGHAGDASTMRATLAAAKIAGVMVGAHPSYPDKEGFGRRSLDMTIAALKQSILDQLYDLKSVATDLDISIRHVKPHGALYNDAMSDTVFSGMIADCVLEVLPAAALVGMPDCVFSTIADLKGLPYFTEAFVDRRYLANGRLVPRSEADAIIGDVSERVAQALSLAGHQTIIACDGSDVGVKADTLCLHGDNDDAVATAKAVRRALERSGFAVAALTSGP